MSSKTTKVSFEYMLFGALVLQVAIETTAIKRQLSHGCHDNSIVLHCPPFQESGDMELRWQYVETNNATMEWTTIAEISRKGKMLTLTNETHLEGRLDIYRNGSIEISHLKEQDERMYRCQVLRSSSGKSRRFHFVEIKLTCKGGSKITTRQVCTETDIILDCKPSHDHHHNPSAIVTWHKKHSQDNTLSWSRVLDTNSTAVHSNGSLWIRGGRSEGFKMFRCDVVKDREGSGKETHHTIVKDVVCRREKRQTDTKHHVTVCAGDQARLPCSALQHVNASRIRLIKWRVRRSLGSKHWTEIAHLKTRHQDKLNHSSLSEVKMDSVDLEPNGSLCLKNASEVNGDFECIVKTTHDHKTARSSVHVIVTRCKQRIRVEPTAKVTSPQASHTQGPQRIQESTPTPQEALTTQVAQARTSATQQAPPSISTQEVMTKSMTQEAQSSTIVRHERGSYQNASTKIVIGPSVTTSTSSWSVGRPVVHVQTTVVTTVTTSITSADQQNVNYKQTVCGGSLTSISGGFHSPNYPKAYPANSYCKWTITVPQDYTAIHITLSDVNLEHEDNCRNDNIAVSDELGNQVGSRHCGVHDWPISVRVSGKKAIVVFTSDHSVEKTGFKLTYKGVLKES